MQRLRDVAELVLAQLAEMLGHDRPCVWRHVLAALGKVRHLDEQALLDIAGAKAPRLDRLDDLEHAFRVLERHLQCLGRVLERALEIAVLVEIPDEVLSHVV